MEVRDERIHEKSVMGILAWMSLCPFLRAIRRWVNLTWQQSSRGLTGTSLLSAITMPRGGRPEGTCRGSSNLFYYMVSCEGRQARHRNCASVSELIV